MIFIYLFIICVFVIFIINLIFNFVIIKRNYKIFVNKTKSSFKIAHLSDIHGIKTKYKGNKIIKTIEKEKPEIVAITGDLIDCTDYNKGKFPKEKTIEFMKELIKISPVYYVFGNHEQALYEDETDEGNNFLKLLEEIGIKIINNEADEILINENNISVLGIQEPQLVSRDKHYGDTAKEELELVLKKVKKEDFKILLAHRPEYFEIYSEYDINLCLTGHAHGGQFRFPFIKGLYAPNQGWFPKYTKGEYDLKDTKMIVSPGLGNSIFKFRIFNPLEINIISVEK